MHPRNWLTTLAQNFSALSGLQGRLRALALLSMALLALGVIWQTYASIASTRREALDNATALNDKLVLGDEARIRQTLAAIDTALGVVVQDVQGNPRYNQAQLMRRLRGLHLDPAQRPVIAVADAQGTVFAVGAIGMSDPDPSATVNVGDREYFIRQRDSQGDTLQIGTPVMSRKFKVMILPITRKVLGPDGSFRGIVTLSIRPESFAMLHAARALEASSVRAVLTREGRVLVRQRGEHTSYGDDASKSPIFQFVGQRAVGNFVAASPIDGVVRLTSYRLLEPYGIIALASASREAVLATTTGKVQDTLLAGAAILVLSQLVLLGVWGTFERRHHHWLDMTRLASREAFLLEQIPVMFLFARPSGAGHVIYRCNELLLRTLEYRREDLLGCPLETLFPDLQIAAIQGDAATPRQIRTSSGKTVYAMVTLSQANPFEDTDPGAAPGETGETGDGGASGQGFCISLTDVSPFVELKRSLFTKDLNFQRLLDVLPEHIRIFDSQEVLIWANFNASEYFGFGPDKVNVTLADFNRRIHAEDLAQALENRRRLLETGLAQEAMEVRLQRFDGEFRWFSIRIASMLDEDGAVQKLIAICTDVDDRKRMEERVALSQRLETTGQLAGGMAHDFNNLLSIIMGNLDLAKSNVRDPASLQQLDVALGAAERGANLVKSLLTLASQQVLKPVVADLNAKLGAMLPLLLQAVGPRVKISQVLRETGLRVMVDVARLESCLLNLAVNARDAMPDGGSLEITLQAEAHWHEGRGREFACIRIADTGMGMSEEVQRRALEPFFTTKERGRGTGLGLSMVAGFVHQSGGHLEMASKPGVGTTITIRLPLCSQHALAPAAEPGPSAVQQREGTILVVDDEVEIAALVAAWSRKAGYQVHVAHGTDAAIDIMLKHPVDLVVSDVVMPGRLNGFDLVEFIREEFEGTRVLLMSGYSREAIEKGGAQRFPMLSKPVRQPDYLDALARLLPADAPAGSPPHAQATEPADADSITL